MVVLRRKVVLMLIERDSIAKLDTWVMSAFGCLFTVVRMNLFEININKFVISYLTCAVASENNVVGQDTGDQWVGRMSRISGDGFHGCIQRVSRQHQFLEVVHLWHCLSTGLRIAQFAHIANASLVDRTHASASHTGGNYVHRQPSPGQAAAVGEQSWHNTGTQDDTRSSRQHGQSLGGYK